MISVEDYISYRLLQLVTAIKTIYEKYLKNNTQRVRNFNFIHCISRYKKNSEQRKNFYRKNV